MKRARDKSDARAQRLASGRYANGSFRALLMAASRSCAVQRLFFGDFLLAPQKKVTALPGAHPGNLPMSHSLSKSNPSTPSLLASN